MPSTTVRFDPKTRVQLDNMAEQIDKSCAWIIKEAVAQYLEREAWYLAEVQKGVDDIEAGREISHEEMGARLKAKWVVILASRMPFHSLWQSRRAFLNCEMCFWWGGVH